MCAARGNTRLVTQWRTHFGRLEAAREEDTSAFSPAELVESGLGVAATEREDQEKVVRAPLRQSTAVDALPV